jgi:hypothetical protein
MFAEISVRLASANANTPIPMMFIGEGAPVKRNGDEKKPRFRELFG